MEPTLKLMIQVNVTMSLVYKLERFHFVVDMKVTIGFMTTLCILAIHHYFYYIIYI